MAAVVTRNQPGRMAKQIVAAFSSQQLAGRLAGMGQTPTRSGITQGIIGRGFDFLSQRFGTPAGTIVVNPDGSVIQRQTSGVPIHTQAPLTFGGRFDSTLFAPDGFGAALGGTTGLLLIGGIVVLVVLVGGGRRR